MQRHTGTTIQSVYAASSRTIAPSFQRRLRLREWVWLWQWEDSREPTQAEADKRLSRVGATHQRNRDVRDPT